MNELFTFNSQQLQTSMARPASTDNPPNIRKRIIKSIISKKPSLQASSPHRQQILPSSNQKRQTPVKKVTFNLQNSHISNKDKTGEFFQKSKKSTSMNQNQIEQSMATMLWKKMDLNRFPLQDIKNAKATQKIGKRSLSTADSRNRLVEIIKNEENIEKQVGNVRQKRLVSLKLSPKIVPISDNRLPKAFKVKCLPDNTITEPDNTITHPQKRKIKISQILSSQINANTLRDECKIQTAINEISKLQKMLKVQAKIFEKLFHPWK